MPWRRQAHPQVLASAPQTSRSPATAATAAATNDARATPPTAAEVLSSSGALLSAGTAGTAGAVTAGAGMGALSGGGRVRGLPHGSEKQTGGTAAIGPIGETALISSFWRMAMLSRSVFMLVRTVVHAARKSTCSHSSSQCMHG